MEVCALKGHSYEGECGSSPLLNFGLDISMLGKGRSSRKSRCLWGKENIFERLGGNLSAQSLVLLCQYRQLRLFVPVAKCSSFPVGCGIKPVHAQTLDSQSSHPSEASAGSCSAPVGRVEQDSPICLCGFGQGGSGESRTELLGKVRQEEWPHIKNSHGICPLL